MRDTTRTQLARRYERVGSGSGGGKWFEGGEETRSEARDRAEESMVAVHDTIRPVRTGHVTARSRIHASFGRVYLAFLKRISFTAVARVARETPASLESRRIADKESRAPSPRSPFVSFSPPLFLAGPPRFPFVGVDNVRPADQTRKKKGIRKNRRARGKGKPYIILSNACPFSLLHLCD